VGVELDWGIIGGVYSEIYGCFKFLILTEDGERCARDI